MHGAVAASLSILIYVHLRFRKLGGFPAHSSERAGSMFGLGAPQASKGNRHPDERMMPRRRRTLIVLLLAAVYALCYSAIKTGLAFAPPLRFAGLRATIAGGTLLLLLAVRRGPVLPSRRLWPGVLLIAATGTSLSYGTMFLSPGRTGAGIASVLGNTTPLLAIVLAALVLGERVTRAKLGALILGFAGVSMIAYPAVTGTAGAGLLGAVLPVIAASGAAGESVVVKKIDVGAEILPVAAYQLFLGGLALLAISASAERGVSIVWSGWFVSLLLFLALIGTAFATVVWYWLLQGDEVGHLTLYLFVVPIFGLGLAAALFGERLGALEWTGVLLTLTGVAWVTRDGLIRSPDARSS